MSEAVCGFAAAPGPESLLVGLVFLPHVKFSAFLGTLHWPAGEVSRLLSFYLCMSSGLVRGWAWKLPCLSIPGENAQLLLQRQLLVLERLFGAPAGSLGLFFGLWWIFLVVFRSFGPGGIGGQSLPIDSQSTWQNGKTERAGQPFKRHLWDMDEECHVKGRMKFEAAIAECCDARNRCCKPIWFLCAPTCFWIQCTLALQAC